MDRPIPRYILRQFANTPVQRMEWLDATRLRIWLPDRTVTRVIGTQEGYDAWLGWADRMEERRLAARPAPELELAA
jgi:hypothetical protein